MTTMPSCNHIDWFLILIKALAKLMYQVFEEPLIDYFKKSWRLCHYSTWTKTNTQGSHNQGEKNIGKNWWLHQKRPKRLKILEKRKQNAIELMR